MEPVRMSMPEADYLTKLGQMVYLVSGLEWTVLGDLQHLSRALPPPISVETLAGRTTGAIARALQTAADEVAVEPVAAFLRAAGLALGEVAQLRNHVMHARPATIRGAQRLYRWRASGDAFAITDEWLATQIRRIEMLTLDVDGLRASAAAAACSM